MQQAIKAKDLTSIIAVFLTTFIYVFVGSNVYAFLEGSVSNTNIYNSLEAIGAIFFGFFSDKICRRKACLLTQAMGLILFLLMYQFQGSIIFVMLFGFLYNPLPILRAGLIDELPNYSKVKLISFSFVIQFLPWSFYNKIVHFDKNFAFTICLIALVIGLFIVWFFFFDKRDQKAKNYVQLDVYKFIHKHSYKKFIYTLCAFFPAQLVYFFSDNLLESFSTNPEFYSIISFSSIVGALISSLYKKTPHTSVLTISYGINMLLSIIPISALFIYHYSDISVPVQLIIFSSLAGFGIPFVYDIALNSVDVHFRGTTCGILDFVFSASSLVNVFFINVLNLNIFFTFLIITISFGLATFLQKKAE